jgi:hypothetical protein
MDIKGVELFKTGRWNDVKTFNREDLDAMAASFAELKLAGRVPLKMGHNDDQPFTDGQPALGWVERVWREGDVLKADFTHMPSVVHAAIKAGNYKFVSVELLRDVAYNGMEFPWVLSAVALLGADIPAVSGLKDLQMLAMSRRAGFRSGARLTFTRAVTTNGGRKTMGNQTEEPTLADVLGKLADLTGKVEKLSSDNATLKADNDRLKKEATDREAATAAEKVKTHRTAIKERFDAAITNKAIRPSAREMFEKNPAFKDDGAVLGLTLDFVDSYIKENTVSGYTPPKAGGGQDTREDDPGETGDPDERVRKRTFAKMEKSGGKLNYFTAQKEVLREDPKLAEEYRSQPGTTGGKAA